MHDFTTEFSKCVKFHRKFTERVSEIQGKFTGPTDVILRCCANANEEISIYYTKSRLKTVNVNYLVLKCDT